MVLVLDIESRLVVEALKKSLYGAVFSSHWRVTRLSRLSQKEHINVASQLREDDPTSEKNHTRWMLAVPSSSETAVWHCIQMHKVLGNTPRKFSSCLGFTVNPCSLHVEVSFLGETRNFAPDAASSVSAVKCLERKELQYINAGFLPPK